MSQNPILKLHRAYEYVEAPNGTSSNLDWESMVAIDRLKERIKRFPRALVLEQKNGLRILHMTTTTDDGITYRRNIRWIILSYNHMNMLRTTQRIKVLDGSAEYLSEMSQIESYPGIGYVPDRSGENGPGIILTYQDKPIARMSLPGSFWKMIEIPFRE